MFNVHVRINDAGTGQPTPVRLRISDTSGREFAPLGRLPEFATGRNEDVGGHVQWGREHWCYIDGSCEVPLPSGVPLIVEAAKGIEYRPLRQEVTLGSGQMALRFQIERWIDPNKERWYSGDTRCHFLSPHAALLEGQAEALSVIQLLAAESRFLSQNGMAYPAIPNMVAFSGQHPAIERNGHLVAVNTLNTHPVLGSLALLHCHRAVFPLRFGEPDSTDDWSLADWCDQCHRKNGLVVWVDPFRSELPIAPEALANLILGRVDAVECSPHAIRLQEYYRAWSAGIRFPLVGASGKDSNRGVLGSLRTYARLAEGQGLELKTWIDAVRAGRTFVTDGPLLNLAVNGSDPGRVIDVASPGTRLSIDLACQVERPAPIPCELIVNGVVIDQLSLTNETPTTLRREIEVSEPTWIAARCPGTPRSGSFAHTSPIFVRVDGRLPASAETLVRLDSWLNRTVDWIESVGRFDNLRRKEQLLEVIQQARQSLATRNSTN